jgi:hypothetical protein
VALNLGFQPKSEAMKRVLRELLPMSKYLQVIVHHATDTSEGLQLEVEYRNPWKADCFEPEAVSFQRLLLK